MTQESDTYNKFKHEVEVPRQSPVKPARSLPGERAGRGIVGNTALAGAIAITALGGVKLLADQWDKASQVQDKLNQDSVPQHDRVVTDQGPAPTESSPTATQPAHEQTAIVYNVQEGRIDHVPAAK